MVRTPSSRRAFLRAGIAAAAVGALPRPLRAQARTFKIGAIHPVTGPIAEPGQASRLGAQMAVDAINVAGGIKALGGMKLELLGGDTQSKPDVARTEAERLVNVGAQFLVGAFDSGAANAIVPVAQQRRVPFLVDIGAVDAITANVAKSVREGQQKVQYVYRNFPTASAYGPRSIRHFDEIFKAAGVTPKRVVLIHGNDLFGQNQAKGWLAAHKALSPSWEIVDVIPFPEPPADLSTEVSRLKASKPDLVAPITRPASAQILLPELRKQRVEALAVWGPGSSGLYEAGQIAALKEDLEYVLDNVPWPNFKNPRTNAVAEEYRTKSGGKRFDTNSCYSYDALLIAAAALERAKSTDADAIVDALKKTNFTDGLMVYSGPVVFNEQGDNPNAIPVTIQILGQQPVVVWPRDTAVQKFVFPRPKA
jgi:branched-chain amino acid transport system substrate-binding protein